MQYPVLLYFVNGMGNIGGQTGTRNVEDCGAVIDSVRVEDAQQSRQHQEITVGVRGDAVGYIVCTEFSEFAVCFTE